jgi:hypothetical protein
MIATAYCSMAGDEHSCTNCTPISDHHDRQGLTTVLQILRKRQSQEEQNRRKSLRAKGRRVSFAPDDELETRHLFSIVSVLLRAAGALLVLLDIHTCQC